VQLVLKVKSVPRAFVAYLVPSVPPVLLVIAAPWVTLELLVSQVQSDTRVILDRKAYVVSRVLKVPAALRDPLASMVRPGPPVKTAPSALLVLLAATVSLALKANPASPALRALQGRLVHLEHLLLPPFLQCPLAPASSTAWCALSSTANPSLAPPCHSPGTVS
jgi:hypothetical protein